MVAAALEATDAGAADDDVTLVVVRGEARLGRVARLRLSPDPDALVSLRRLTARWLREAGAEADETHDLVMAANEAWQNALEHGTQFARATVGIDLEVDDHHEVTITVRDPGPALAALASGLGSGPRPRRRADARAGRRGHAGARAAWIDGAAAARAARPASRPRRRRAKATASYTRVSRVSSERGSLAPNADCLIPPRRRVWSCVEQGRGRAMACWRRGRSRRATRSWSGSWWGR